jgi:uncharacterized cupin superfamily protein
MATPRMDITSFVGKLLEQEDVDALREGVRVLAQAVMETEVSSRSAPPYERSSELTHSRMSPRLVVPPEGAPSMEPHPGLFVTSATTEDWGPDPDVPESAMHELVHADGVWAGLTRFTEVDGSAPWTPERREVVFVIEGSARIELEDGASFEVGPGDLFSLPPGVATTWQISVPFKEVWVLASD